MQRRAQRLVPPETLQAPKRQGTRPARSADKRKAPKKQRKPAMEVVQVASYRLLGRHLEKEDPRLQDRLVRAGLPLSTGMYHGLMLAAGLSGFVLVGLLAGLGFWAVMGFEGAAYGVLVGAVAGLAAWAAFPFVLKSRVQNRSQAIERELPFALSELSVLAGIGLSPIVLIRRMAGRVHDPATTGEFRRIVALVDTEGRDLVSAMSEVARSSASETFRSTLWDMANLMHQGGDLETYLRGQSDTVLEEVRANQESFTDQLGTYADMYITIVLMGVMFLAVGAFMIDAFRSTVGPLTASGLLNVLTFGLVPVVVLVLGLLLSTAHGRSQS